MENNKLNSNISGWDQIEQSPTTTYKQLFKIERELIIRQRVVKDNIDLKPIYLDIGCGSGRNLNNLKENCHRNSSQKIIGLDDDKQALSNYKNRTKDTNDRPILLYGSAFNLPFLNESIDFCLLSMALCNFGKQKIDSLREIERVLIPGSKAIVSTYSENALEERLEVYRSLEAPIKDVNEKTGLVDFGPEIGISEQISISQMQKMCKLVGLKIKEIHVIENLAYVFVLEK